MTPSITHARDLTFLYETLEGDKISYTTLAVRKPDDTAYFGQMGGLSKF